MSVLQGERPMARDNRPIGRFILGDIPPAPRGVPQIEVTFDIDSNGIISVSAQDKGTGKKQTVRIEAGTGLSKEEIEKMKNDATANADSDRKARERAEKINQADGLIFQTEKQLKEYGDKIPAAKKGAIETALANLKTAHAAQDDVNIDKSLEALNAAWQDASQDMYAAQQSAGGAENGAQHEHTEGAHAGQDSNVEDATYEEVK